MNKFKKIVYKSFGTIGLTISIFGASKFLPRNNAPVYISKTIAESVNTAIEEELVEYHPIFSNNKNNILNLSITKSSLKRINNIYLDVAFTDLSDLKYLTNLETLSLYNYELLSNNDKNIINKLPNLKNLEIYTNFNNLDDNLDIDWVNKDFNIIFYHGAVINNLELVEIQIYRKLINLKEKYPKVKFVDKYITNKTELQNWDYKLKQIINKFNFDNNMTDEEKIIKIVDYVTTYLNYDKSVYKDTSKRKIKKYNHHLLKCMLTNNSKKGICANYAALTCALATYSNIDLKYNSGEYKNNRHAWCSYNDSIIDPTFLDNDKQYKKLMIYYNQKLSKYYNKLLNKVFDKNKKYYNYDKENKVIKNKIEHINEQANNYNTSSYIYFIISIIGVYNSLGLIFEDNEKNDINKKTLKN